jgi:hypothetical protein
VASGSTFQFKATHTNTSSSNLTTPATGSKSLVNTDGSNLAASAIQANAVVEVSYDGTRFVLRKRPINDRFAVLSSN